MPTGAATVRWYNQNADPDFSNANGALYYMQDVIGGKAPVVTSGVCTWKRVSP